MWRLYKYWQIALLTIIVLFASACSKSPEPEKSPKPFSNNTDTKTLQPVYHNYTLTGDLEKIQQSGYLRLLATRQLNQQLPRNEIPSEIYHQQAEDFAHSLNLEPVWIYVEEYSELAPQLISGKGDIIATNFTKTKQREKQVNFTRALNIIDELLVHLAASTINIATDKFSIGFAKGTSFAETAKMLQQKNPAISLVELPGTTTKPEILQGILNNQYDTTILDSNMVDIFLKETPLLKKGQTVNDHRELAWAVRKNNPVLKSRINQYLISNSISALSNHNEKRDWKAIKQHGVLRAITMNTPNSYFILKGELMGFDYELIKRFAEQHKLRLQMVVKDSPVAMINSLLKGEGDVIAGSMTATANRRNQGIVFSKPYLQVSEKLIGSTKAKPIGKMEDLNGLTIAVNPHSSFHDTLLSLRDSGINLTILPLEGLDSEKLIAEVANKTYDYTVADSHTAQLEKTYRDDNINIMIELSNERDIAWGLRKDQSALKKRLDQFISKEYRGLFYNIIYKKYFEKKKNIAHYYKQRIEPGKKISPFDHIVQEYANKHNADWRLIVSQIYQESQFDPKAKSYAGAQGLMQLMPRTANSFGYTNLQDPKENIAAGLTYQDWLKKRFPATLPLEEKTYFTLAAYNAGHGHVNDARHLAKNLGKNPNIWFDNVEDAMLLLSEPKYYHQARYGYVRGNEPVNYVRQIRNRYLAYVEASE